MGKGMEAATGRLLAGWLRARRWALLCFALMLGCFFAVYGLYGYEWGVAGYAALLAAAVGLVFGVADFTRFAGKVRALAPLAGRFPTGPLPPAADFADERWHALVAGLEAERARLEQQNDLTRRDAEEYYTLWAHQIKTPMAAMGLLLQSEARQAAGPERRPAIDSAIEQELFRIGQYVEMVLQYQRLSSLTSDLALARCELKALAGRAAKNCAPLFIRGKVSFSIENVQGSVITDAKWMVFVLEQLYTNALKYTPAGSVTVRSENGGQTLVVADTGIGIPAADLPRVFERGFTGAAGRTERSSTGIGLYLCREILARLGFGITIESEQGKGTRVLLHLAQTELPVD